MNLIRFSDRMDLTLQIYVFFSYFMCLMIDFTLVLYRIDCPTQWPNGCSVYCTSWLAPTCFPRLAMPQPELYFHSYDLRAWVEVALSGNAWIVIPCYHMFGDTPKLKMWAEKENLMIMNNLWTHASNESGSCSYTSVDKNDRRWPAVLRGMSLDDITLIQWNLLWHHKIGRSIGIISVEGLNKLSRMHLSGGKYGGHFLQ